MGLFVILGRNSNIPILLDESEDKMSIISMGVDVANPDIYKTACGKGYWKCEKNEPEVINLKLPAINFFQTESANSFFYWDRKKKAFKRIWISD